MILSIDNFDISGPRDYTRLLDGTFTPKVVRRLNEAATMDLALVTDGTAFFAPVENARVVLQRSDGAKLFTGYLAGAPEPECVGEGERGPVYRYKLHVLGDESLLDRKPTTWRAPFTRRTVGSAVRELVKDVGGRSLRTDGVQDVETLVSYVSDPQVKCSAQIATMARLARCVYRAHDEAISFSPIGSTRHMIDETDVDVTPASFNARVEPEVLNDITVTGRVEPLAYVKDYFLGDGYTLQYNLSELPFARRNLTMVEEEYAGTALRAQYWALQDASAKVSVAGGKLKVAGGTGVDGATVVSFVEQMELGGATMLQHGDVTFTASSDGVIGGLYSGGITAANCVAGFRVTKSGAQSAIQAVVNGVANGASMTTVSGRRYSMTTRFYSSEPYRTQQVFHSSVAAAGAGKGGATTAANVRVVLEAREIDPNNPASLATASTVLYDGVVTNAPAYCTYGLVNSKDLHCEIAYTLLKRIAQVLVRSTKSGQAARTRLAGAQVDGAECGISSVGDLYFFAAYPPLPNEAIQATYRSSGRAMARVVDVEDAAARMHSGDDGVRGAMRNMQTPAARTSVDCENAALALLDDHTRTAWSGEYETWNEFLPGGASDVWPGDDVDVNAPSRQAQFRATIREVEIEARDVTNDRAVYKMKFANDAAAPLSCEFSATVLREPIDADRVTGSTGSLYLDATWGAEITAVASTTVAIDTGMAPSAGGGIEVRRSDSGWEPGNDRNLVGRFATRNFTVPRLTRVQDYWMRQYDASTPPRYSRYSTLLHLDYPL